MNMNGIMNFKNHLSMKHLFIGAVAAAMLAGCTSSDELGVTPPDESTKQAIVFDSPFVKNTTRATGDLSNDNITSQTIRVWGDKYQAGGTSSASVFNGSGGDYSALLSHGSAWDCNKLAFWETGYTYDFTAVAPSSVSAAYGNDGTLANSKLTISGIPLVQTIGSAETDGDDILVAGAQKLTSGTVSLSFRHMLSRFSIYAYTSIAEGSGTVTINGLSIYLPEGTAQYAATEHANPTVGTWTWNGFTNSTASPDETNYKGYTIPVTDFTVKYAASPSAALALTDAKLGQEFFIAPTPGQGAATTTDLQLYMDIDYTVTTNGVSDQRSATHIAIQDLHSFMQGHQTNLYICVNKPTAQTYTIKFNSISVDGYEGTSNIGKD